ncbi:MAG: hypothetical protein LBN30_04580 [Oscillospiraceae bacterium]|jgi:dihydrodipicolinate synthase/N-acetylneuraminate lyase|nr:hypothetical protein [Oscillospiraceae bacterium]
MSKASKINFMALKAAEEHEKKLRDLRIKATQSIKVAISYAAITALVIYLGLTGVFEWYYYAAAGLAVLIIPYFSYQAVKSRREIKRLTEDIERVLNNSTESDK